MNEFKQLLQDLQKSEERDNKKCIDCGAFYPQWASVTHGIMFCLGKNSREISDGAFLLTTHP